MSSKERLKKLSSGTSLGWLDDANYVEDNSEMLEMTGRIALAIIKVMKQKGLTKKDLAKLLGISPQSVSKQLSGNANFTLETMAKYGKILGIRFEVKPTYMGKGVLDDDYSSESIFTFKDKTQSVYQNAYYNNNKENYQFWA